MSAEQQQINYGSEPNDGTGDPLRTAFIKTDDNFDAIWAAGPVGSNVTIVDTTVAVTTTNGNLVLKPNGVGSIQANASVLPNTANIRDLGSNSQRWRSAWVGTGGIDSTGNVTAGYFVGNGSLLTGVAGTYGNANVAAYLDTYTGNISAGAVRTSVIESTDSSLVTIRDGLDVKGSAMIDGALSAVGNISGAYFVGNGSQLTGIASTYGNANVVANLAALGSNPIVTTGNITAGNFLGNGSQLTGITGNVTFNNQAVVGTGDQQGASGLYLAPGTESVGNLQYLRVRGGDLPTHIHLDTGNNTYFDQYFGDDNKYVKLANTGNIVINTNNLVDASAQWTFGTDGKLNLPGANADYTIATQSGYITVGNLLIGQGGSLFNSNNDSWALYGNISDPGTSISIPSDAAAGNGTPLVLENQISNVEIRSGFGTWTFDTTGNLTAPGNILTGGIVSATGNVIGNYFIGNGSQLTGISGNIANITANVITFNTSAGISVDAGQMAWNSADGTLDIGLSYADVVLQVGQETHYVVRNDTGNIIQNGTAVYCSGVAGGSGRIEASPMTGSTDPVKFLGLATQDISNGVNGVVTYFGYVRGLDTRGTANTAISVGNETWAVGDQLYVHPTAAGKLTNVEPAAPNVKICVASIMIRNQTAGVVFVRPTTNLYMTDLSDVQITTPAANQFLVYVGNRWENTALDISLDTTPTLGGNLAGAGFDISNVGNVSAVGNITGGNLSVTGNITGNYILGNGSQLTSINAVTVDVTDTNGLTTVYYPTFVENRTTTQIARADVDLTYRTDDNLLTVGNVSVTGNITGGNILGNGAGLTGVVTTTTGSWNVTAGTNNYSFTVPPNGVYQLWIEGNIANGIIAYNATVSVTNTNVPVLGQQFAWNYEGAGNPILITSIPDQIIGTAGAISNAAPAVGTTTNTFVFGISNTSGSNVTVSYGYAKIS